MSEIQTIEIPLPLLKNKTIPSLVLLVGSDEIGNDDPDDFGAVVIDAGTNGSWKGEVKASDFKIVSYQTEDTINFLYLYLVKVFWQGLHDQLSPESLQIRESGGTDDVTVTVTDSGGTVVGTMPIKVVID